MNHDLSNLKNEAYKIRMTPAEKAAMRSQLFLTPTSGQVGVPSYTSTASPYFFFNIQFATRAFAGVLLILVVLGGGGTAFAAETALPGDLLYSMKVNVNEPIKTALAVGAQARADVHLELAQRRVEEAESLAAAGKLDATTTQELEANFESHAQDADELALEVGHEDPAAAEEIQNKLSSSLSVHGAILAALGSDSNNGDNKNNSHVLAARVLARADEHRGLPRPTRAIAAVMRKGAAPIKATDQNNGDTEATAPATFAVTAAQTTTSNVATSASATSTEKNKQNQNAKNKKAAAQLHAANQTQTRAITALANAHDAYDSMLDSLSASAKTDVDAQLANGDQFMQDGAAALATGDTATAHEDFTLAYKLALKLKAILNAQKKYKKDFTPLLNGGTHINSTVEATTTSSSSDTQSQDGATSGKSAPQDQQDEDTSPKGSQEQNNSDKNKGDQQQSIIKPLLKAL